MIVDLMAKPKEEGYDIVVIGREGNIEKVVEHFPWFAVYVKKTDAMKVKSLIEKTPGVYKVEVSDRIPLILVEDLERYEPRLDYRMLKVYTPRKDYVRNMSIQIKTQIPGARIGVSNIVYTVRSAFDLNIKFFSEKTPLILLREEERINEFKKVLSRLRDLKILAFDIEVYTKGARFPKPGDPILSIQYGLLRLGDKDFFQPYWIKEKVETLVAETTRESEDLVEKFINNVYKLKPDIIVGYNSSYFDLKYMKPFLKRNIIHDLSHIQFYDRIIPHIDLMQTRKSLGSSLGVRSQRALALDDVAYDVAGGIAELKWFFGSKYFEAEKKLDHTKINREWEKRTELFYNYIKADVYLTLILAKLWLPVLVVLSSLTQIPVTEIARLNTGQTAEYNIINILEKVFGYEPELIERELEFRKALRFPKKIEEYLGEVKLKDLFKHGKVYVKYYGLVKHIVEGDFAQLYPTLMVSDSVDPTAVRLKKKIEVDSAIDEVNVNDKAFEIIDGFPVILGKKPSKSADHIIPIKLYVVGYGYGIISFIIYTLFKLRKLTKKLKKQGKEYKILDQAIKILNNSTYGAFSKRRGFINQVVAAYVFWKTMKLFLDLIEYAEKNGLEIVYGDTDSVFIRVPEGIENIEEWGERVVRELEEYIKEKYGEEFILELEDFFDFCLYPKQKYSNEPSKKSYLCGNVNGNEVKLKVIKGDFYKVTAVEGIREDLDELYKVLLEEKVRSRQGIEKIFRKILSNKPLYKMFIKKTIDSFKGEISPKEKKLYLVKIKNLNKPWHYAGLHIAYIWNLDGVEKVYEKKLGENTFEVEYKVSADKVLSTGSIIVMFLPENDPTRAIVYVDEEGDNVIVDKIKIRSIEKMVREENGAIIEEGYKVREVFRREKLSRKEIMDLAIKSMRKYIISDIEKKLIPALVRNYGGVLDRYMS